MAINSLLNSINATDKVNDIKLSLRSPNGENIVWVLNEGENDCRLYQKFFIYEKAKVEFVGGGKSELAKALVALKNESNQVIGIRDADFLNIEGEKPEIANMFLTDCHDIEMSILKDKEILDNLLNEYRINAKSENIMQNVLDETSFVGYIRWYNEINSCEIVFKGLKYGDHITIDQYTVTIDKEKLFKEILVRVKGTFRIELHTINSFIQTKKTNDLYNLCNGHDVSAIISLLIGSSISEKEFCRHLRISYQLQHFVKTHLYSELIKWEQKNKFTILKTA